ncbi:uncharacterized protein LOC123408824 isoform X2 [Hordeum vulgare subsp. vulgare]|uniref:uncharacterized protein LOC123408824 isoform X2 n=1 Tax=Hordeum vulgare subsp. vulgare TaxID=112509 RepID=UPI001D1A3843|nr:uncharacterized protein LOC123408824 isoform X2 [Hordeum vulgare subsp. vulgare]
MAVGTVDRSYKKVDFRKQVLVVVTSGWAVMCFYHNLKKLWEVSLGDDFPHAPTTARSPSPSPTTPSRMATQGSSSLEGGWRCSTIYMCGVMMVILQFKSKQEASIKVYRQSCRCRDTRGVGAGLQEEMRTCFVLDPPD